jgi:type I restriction enzyme, S subunit
MKHSVITDAVDHISPGALSNSTTTATPVGSILIVVRSGILAHSLPISRVARCAAFNQDIKAVIPTAQKVDAEYVFWFLRSCERYIIRQGVKKGVTVHSVQSGFIEKLQIPSCR